MVISKSDIGAPQGPRGGVVTQRSAKPCTPVQFRAWPPPSNLPAATRASGHGCRRALFPKPPHGGTGRLALLAQLRAVLIVPCSKVSLLCGKYKRFHWN